MCTVTIIPINENDFVLTSNRDEAPDRISISPEFYELNGAKMLFPKDNMAGGTWIGISEKNRVICLLNGGFSLHKRQLNYRVSRGVVVKELLACESIETSINEINLDNIEPFTLVIADWNLGLKFYELVWDGHIKHITHLPLEPKIWSSSTLYTEVMKIERIKWFESFRKENKLRPETLLLFHKTAGEGNLNFGTIMDRGIVKTTSVTQVEKRGADIHMQYESLQNQTTIRKTMNALDVVNE